MEVALTSFRRLASIWILVWFSWFRRATSKDYRRLEHQARRLVDESLLANVRRRSATPGRIGQAMLWGGRYPLRFAALAGCLFAVIAAAFLPAPLAKLAVIPLPKLPTDYSHSGFFGTVWSVQATLVALVYPFVLTFIAVMLQRRAASKIALSVYLLDSAVLPAGTSSLLLLAAMAVQYFVLVGAPRDLFLGAAVFNGSWFLANLTLTGYFLAKTIRHVEDEVGQLAYRNLAVSLVLRQELVASVSKHLLVSVAQRLKWDAPAAAAGNIGPAVQMLSLSRGKGQATRKLDGEATLVDVHLGALEWVANRWLARAPQRSQVQGAIMRRPLLQFRSMLHGTSIGPVELCSVAEGPDLTPLEAEVVLRAFVFGKRTRSVVAGNTTDMLEELATEVHSLQEQGRHAASGKAFSRMVDLHVELLQACHEEPEVEGDVSSAAGLTTSPYSWGGRNLNTTWLQPYRELISSAVAQLQRDQTLFSSLAYTATNVVAGSELQPPELITELFTLPELLDHAMASWWLKESQRMGATADPNGNELSLPAAEDYRKAIVTLIGGIGSFGYGHADYPVEPSISWKYRCRAARSWAAHVDLSATLLLNAVARGDRVAAEWYCDNFSAWWANHQHEFDYGYHVDYEPGLSEVRLGITELEWAAAERTLSELSKRPVAVEEAQQVVWHALRRYWESMRMVVCLLLLQQAQAEKFPSLAAKVSANVARPRLFHAGPRSEGLDLSEADEALALFVEACFGDAWVSQRLNSFCDRRDRWEDSAPVVSGWMYSGSGGATDVRSKIVSLSQFLFATQPTALESWSKSKEVLDRADMGLKTFEQVASLANSCIALYRGKSFRQFLPIVELMRGALEKNRPMPAEWRALFRGFTRLRHEAVSRRSVRLDALTVSQHAVDRLAYRLSLAMCAPDTLTGPHRFFSVQVRASSGAFPVNATKYKFTKENLTEPPVVQISDSDVKRLAKDFLNHTAVYVLNQLLVGRGANPIEHPDDSTLLTNIEAAAQEIRSRGLSPVAVVAPGSTASLALRPYQWGQPGQPPIPPGTLLSYNKSGPYQFANGFVNDTPVMHSPTPGRATFVVPLEWMKTLVFEPKPLGVIAANYSVTGPNEVTLDFDWSAALQE